MMLSASDSDTSTSEKESAISIAPPARDVTPAWPVNRANEIARPNPGFSANAEEQAHHRSGFILALSTLRAGRRPPPLVFHQARQLVMPFRRPGPALPSCGSGARRLSRAFSTGRNHNGGDFLFLVVTRRRVRHRHGGRRDGDHIELLRQRFDDDARVIVLASQQAFAQ